MDELKMIFGPVILIWSAFVGILLLYKWYNDDEFNYKDDDED